MKGSIQKALSWIIDSSSNPTEVSLTIKGLLLGIVPTLMVVVGFTHLNVGVTDINNIINAITATVQSALALAAAIMTIVGVTRKVWVSIKNA